MRLYKYGILCALVAAGLLYGCSAPQNGELVALPTELPLVAPTNTPNAEMDEVIIMIPMPTDDISPEPTISAEPTAEPTPDPYEGLELHFHEESSDFFYVKLTSGLKKRITGSTYPSSGSVSVSYDDLRYVHVLYVDFNNVEHEGELIVNRLVAAEITDIFYQLYVARYPLSSVRLLDDYGEAFDDNLSMAANNSSAFCYRVVSGTTRLSWHAYGLAVDINPQMNPYLTDDGVRPENGAEYADRSVIRRGMIDYNDLCYQLFTGYGWKWGGDFRNEKDYQHFYKEIEF